jgi:hypothetical protein
MDRKDRAINIETTDNIDRAVMKNEDVTTLEESLSTEAPPDSLKSKSRV